MDIRVEKSILYITKKFQSNIQLDSLADEAGISKFHFHRLFKKATGLTPLAYLNKVRMEYAAHYAVMYPKSKQLEVALESGYSSPSVFGRAFKNHFSKSLSAFRKEKKLRIEE